MKIREHEWSGPGGRVCRICGGYKKPDGGIDPELRCLERGVAAPADERRRIMACEDAEAIARRLTELAAEREAGWNAAALDFRDCCY